MPTATTFSIIGASDRTVDSSWDGSPLTLNEGENVNMEQTPNGSMIFAYENMSAKNSTGKLSLATGAGRPDTITVPPGTGTSAWKRQNWKGENLSVSNISGVDVPIIIQAVGPGIPGNDPVDIVIGTKVVLDPGTCAQTNLDPCWMQLVFSSPGYTATFGLIGGPVDGMGRNAYTFSVNAAESSTIPPGDTPTPGDYSTTSNSFEFSVNWGSSRVFVANLSGSTSQNNSITIVKL